MSALVRSLIISLLVIITNSTDPFGTCDDPFIIFKHTVATSDSYRDCSNLWSVFPDISQEDADKFRQGYCAYQCKMELPYSCFKIHAPQTEQFPQGLLDIDVFEQKLSEKWKSALSSDDIKYDNFFDYNMAFWVKSLEKFIRHWQYAESSGDIQLNYFGIEWTLPDELSIETADPSYKNNKFYSVIIQLPDSQSQFEFISYSRPSKKFYRSIKWYTDSIPRATFKLQSAPYPWDREDGADIMPIRISRATSNLEDMLGFYTDVMEGELLYRADSKQGGIKSYTKTIFMGLQETHIELQFVERGGSAYRIGSFTLRQFESLLMGTHEVISSPYCGQDRWMDNVWAYSTYTIPGLMDKVFNNLVDANVKFKVGKNTPDHTSEHTKYLLDLIGYDGDYTFGLWVIEPGGHAFKVGGIISDEDVAKFASFGDPQWCAHECSWGLEPGDIDMTYRYDGDESYDGYDGNTGYGGYDIGNHRYKHSDNENRLDYIVKNNLYHNSLYKNKIYILYIIIGICIMLTLYLGYYFICKLLSAIMFSLQYIKTKSTNYCQKNRNVNDMENSQRVRLINNKIGGSNYSSFSILED